MAEAGQLLQEVDLVDRRRKQRSGLYTASLLVVLGRGLSRLFGGVQDLGRFEVYVREKKKWNMFEWSSQQYDYLYLPRYGIRMMPSDPSVLRRNVPWYLGNMNKQWPQLVN